ncbi:hypothetical protein BLOT_001995 [Blomia tropicalis]|nr:hypothetical protein BLOT_001995 [Blomia tropicalis]
MTDKIQSESDLTNTLNESVEVDTINQQSVTTTTSSVSDQQPVTTTTPSISDEPEKGKPILPRIKNKDADLGNLSKLLLKRFERMVDHLETTTNRWIPKVKYQLNETVDHWINWPNPDKINSIESLQVFPIVDFGETEHIDGKPITQLLPNKLPKPIVSNYTPKIENEPIVSIPSISGERENKVFDQSNERSLETLKEVINDQSNEQLVETLNTNMIESSQTEIQTLIQSSITQEEASSSSLPISRIMQPRSEFNREFEEKLKQNDVEISEQTLDNFQFDQMQLETNNKDGGGKSGTDNETNHANPSISFQCIADTFLELRT